MKRTGKCTKCGSTDVYTNGAETPRGSDRSFMRISSSHGLYIEMFVCASCGYIEDYWWRLQELDPIRDRGIIKDREELKKRWKKVQP
jgi:predicted nucleic-acid-binding Zn-ribbon protein